MKWNPVNKDYDALAEELKQKLKLQGIYKKSLLFRAFDYKKWKIMKEQGNDDLKRDFVFAGKEGHITYDYPWVLQRGTMLARFGILAKLMRSEGKFAIAFYDRNYFETITLKGECWIKKGLNLKDALVAIVLFSI